MRPTRTRLLRLPGAQDGGDALARLRDHRRRGVERLDVEAVLGEHHGVAAGRAAEIENPDSRRIGELADELRQTQVRLARREALDVLGGIPKGAVQDGPQADG